MSKEMDYLLSVHDCSILVARRDEYKNQKDTIDMQQRRYSNEESMLRKYKEQVIRGGDGVKSLINIVEDINSLSLFDQEVDKCI